MMTGENSTDAFGWRDRYLHGMDAMRAFAAIAIVYLHTADATSLVATTTFARYAVPFFTASAVFFAFTSGLRAPTSPLKPYLGKRFTRIYLPFLAWSLFYFAVRLAAAPLTNSQTPRPDLETLFRGSAYHLWFLPFVLLATTGSYVLAQRVRRKTSQIAASAVLLVVGGFVAITPPPGFGEAFDFFGRLSYATLPAGCWVLSLLLALTAWRIDRVKRKPMQWISWVGLLLLWTALWWFGRNRLLENLAGLWAFAAAASLGTNLRWNGLSRLGVYAYGIYLSHLFFVEGLQDALGVAGIPAVPVVTLAVFAAALSASVCTCVVLARLPVGFVFGVPRLQTATRSTRTSLPQPT